MSPGSRRGDGKGAGHRRSMTHRSPADTVGRDASSPGPAPKSQSSNASPVQVGPSRRRWAAGTGLAPPLSMFKTMAGYSATNRPTRPAGQKTAGLLFLLGALLLGGLALDANSALAGGSHDFTGDLTRRFLAEHAQWQRGDDKVRSEGMQALVSLAAARQQQLAELIADHPDIVLRIALSGST